MLEPLGKGRFGVVNLGVLQMAATTVGLQKEIRPSLVVDHAALHVTDTPRSSESDDVFLTVPSLCPSKISLNS